MPKLRKNRLNMENLEKFVATGQKQYVSYEEGAMLYSLGRNSFIELAKEANAVRHVKGRCIVSVSVLNEFIENMLL